MKQNRLPSRPSVLPLLVFLVATAAVAASACTCGRPLNFSYAEHRLNYDRVFHGEVIDRGEKVEGNVGWMRFRVIKDYTVPALDAEDTATVWSSTWDGTCGVNYPVGRQVLIFADSASGMAVLPRSVLATHLCSFNVHAPHLDSVVRELENPAGVREPVRSPRAAARANGAVVEGGQVFLGGKVLANGALRKTAGERPGAGER